MIYKNNEEEKWCLIYHNFMRIILKYSLQGGFWIKQKDDDFRKLKLMPQISKKIKDLNDESRLFKYLSLSKF